VIRSGWRSALPRRLVLGAAAVLIPVLAGCEAGNEAPTVQFHYPTDAAGTVVGAITISNVFVLGAPLGSRLQKGGAASLFLAVVNNGAPDRLLAITAPGSAASVSLPSGGVPVIYRHPALLSGPQPQLVLTDLTRNITSGSTVKLQLTFQKAGLVTLVVPVVPRAAHYVTYSPAPPSGAASTPAATPTTPATPTTSATSPTPTASPHGSASPKPSPSKT
jgi:copper(I)-binding protein